MPFINFIFTPFNRKILLILFLYHILVAFVFHWAYPFTIYTPDTPNYFLAADAKDFCGYRPYGYSAFINFCMLLYKSIYVIVFFQSFLYFVAIALFIFTIEYISPFKNKKLFYLFTILLSLSGQVFLLNNSLLSDSIFISLSLIWISSLLHLFNSKKNNYYLIALNLIICFSLAKIRYAGLIYPVIGLLAGLFIYRKQLLNLFVYVIGFLLIVLIVYQQGVSQNKTKYGIDVFSAFGGWAKLNNASVVIPEAKDDIREKEMYLLNALFKRYPDSIYSTKNVLTSQLMWGKLYPEKKYLAFIYSKNKVHGYVPSYVYCGKLYGEYANYLIKTHITSFITKFYLPNLFGAISPQDESSGNVHIKVDENIRKVCDTDFDFFAPRCDIYGAFISVFDKIKYATLAILFIFSLTYYVAKKYFKLVTSNRNILFLFISFFIILNSLFLAYVHPVLLRYVIINEFLFIAVIFVFLDECYKLKANK